MRGKIWRCPQGLEDMYRDLRRKLGAGRDYEVRRMIEDHARLKKIPLGDSAAGARMEEPTRARRTVQKPEAAAGSIVKYSKTGYPL